MLGGHGDRRAAQALHREAQEGVCRCHDDLHLGGEPGGALGEPGRHRDVGQCRAQPQRVRAGRGLRLVDDAAPAQVVDQPALRAQLQRRPVLLDHPVQGQRLGRAFQGHHRARVGIGDLRCDQSTPQLAVGTDRAGRPGRQPGTALPVVQQDRGGHPVAGEGQHLTVEVLQHDRGVEHVGGLVEDLLDRGPPQAQRGERLVHPLSVGHLGVLVGDDLPMHLLGDVNEPDPAVQHDHRQRQPASRLEDRGRDPVDVRPELDHHTDRPGARQTGQVLVAPGRVGQRLPRREHPFPAGQQPGQVRKVADVHPAHRGVERPVADQLRIPGLHDGQLQDPAERGLHRRSVKQFAAFLTVRRQPGGDLGPRLEP